MKSLNKKLAICLVAIAPSTSLATQVKIAADNSEIVGKISIEDVNRLSLIGDKVRSVKTNKGSYEYINDEQSGDVYIRALPDNLGEPLNAFVISEKGYTYKILLNPVGIPSEQIFIKNPGINKMDSKKDDAEPLSYKQELISLMKSMNQGEMLPDYEVKTIHSRQKIADKKLKLTKKAIYKGTKYEGGVYVLQNRSRDVVVLDEEQFSREGVRAISLQKLLVEPKEKINLYMIEDRS